MSKEKPIDWTALAQRCGSIQASGDEHSSSDLARAALEDLLGPEVLRSAVDHCVSLAPGSQLASSVLQLLHPWCAMQRCHELFRAASDIDIRRGAVALLRVVADRRVLPRIPEYLADPDPQIQFWGAGILDQLIYSGLIELEECESILAIMKTHPHERIREQYEALMENVQSIADGD